MAATEIGSPSATTALSAHSVPTEPPVAMSVRIDAEGRLTAANDAFVSFFGISRDRTEEVAASQSIGESLVQRIAPHLERALSGERCSFLLPLVDPRGNLCQLRWLLTPDKATGRPHSCTVTITDATAAGLDPDPVTRDAQIYRALARNTPGQFSLLFDHRLRFAFAEGPALSVFGHSAEDMEGRSVAEVMPNVAHELEPRYRAALKGETVRWMRPWGGRMLSVVAAPVRDERGVVFAGLVVGTDVTERHRRETTDDALRKIAEAVANRGELEEVAQLAANGVLAIFNASSAGVARFGDDGVERLAVAPDGSPELGGVGVDATSPGSALEAVVSSGRPTFLRYDERTDEAGRAFLAAGLLATAAAPIRVHNTLWGAVGVAHADLRVEEKEALEWLSDFCSAVTIAISSSAAWAELHRRAATDELTGLANRRAFNEAFAAAVDGAWPKDAPIGLVLVDVNDFKSINDHFGHPTGDEVLRSVATRLASVARARDVVARIGGDEFAVLLTESDAEHTAEVAERLRSAVGDVPVDGIVVTVSCGAACTDAARGSAEELVTAADRALYEAKNTR